MTKATITAKEGYSCCPDGHTVKHFEFGAVVHGNAAEFAIADGAASVEKAKPAPKATKVAKPATEKKG